MLQVADIIEEEKISPVKSDKKDDEDEEDEDSDDDVQVTIGDIKTQSYTE